MKKQETKDKEVHLMLDVQEDEALWATALQACRQLHCGSSQVYPRPMWAKYLTVGSTYMDTCQAERKLSDSKIFVGWKGLGPFLKEVHDLMKWAFDNQKHPTQLWRNKGMNNMPEHKKMMFIATNPEKKIILEK